MVEVIVHKSMKKWEHYPISLHSLLMVKPFNSNEKFVVDKKSLTANWDIPTMITNALNLTNSYPWNDKYRVRDHVTGEWERSRHPQNWYKFNHHYRVHGDMFNIDNWELLK